MTAARPASPAAAVDWLAYYSSISSVKMSLEDRFVSLTVRQSVGAVGGIGLIGLIDGELGAPRLACLVGVVAALGVGLLGFLAYKYFLQVRALGKTMAHLEHHRLHLTLDEGVKMKLCNDARLSIFTVGKAPWWCVVNSVVLTVTVLLVALFVGLGAG